MVMKTEVATAVFKDGQVVNVDGTNGVVTIIDAAFSEPMSIAPGKNQDFNFAMPSVDSRNSI